MVVSEGFAKSVTILLAKNYMSGICQQLVLAVGKATGQSCWQRNPIGKAGMFSWENAQLCQQLCPMFLAKLGSS
jgi:hypothetical protein